MTGIAHHLSDAVIRAHAAGALPHGFAVIATAHASVCPDCRARLEAEECAGGAVLDALSPVAVGSDARARALASLDAPPCLEAPPVPASGIFPGPVMAALGGQPPRWHSLGGGIRQQLLDRHPAARLRLLYIPPGQAVPEHGHGGLEMTLVLQGSFRDETGRYGPGDVETADAALDHTPVAEPGMPCICLAATDAPLRFRGLLPRLLQPLFRI